MKKPELLAPAGNIESGLIAFECGADAIYLGLAKFNARERAENCSIDEVAKLIRYARRNGRKVYVALNTLVKERELKIIAEILGELVFLAPHAVIVQDLGIIRMIRHYFPSLSIHASTQMGVHNSAEANFLGDLGVERIIVERQVTITELKLMLKNTAVPLEIFVHGALCCSRSGSCLFSSWLGGWSGNRGKCKQPCRRRFFSQKGNGFFFSTNDLCMIDIVPELRNLDIASLKIEGRLRSPDYVKHVVTAYRIMLDAASSDEMEALKEAKSHIMKSLGRKWSHGFWTDEDSKKVINHTIFGTSGLLCGRVEQNTIGGFRVNLSRTLEIGDRIRVQPDSGQEGPSLTITRLSIGKRTVKKANRGQTCFIHCDKEVPDCGYIFKIACAHPNLSAKIAKLPSYSIAIDLDIKIHDSVMEINFPTIPGLRWESAISSDTAKSHSLTAKAVKNEFLKTDLQDFIAARINVSMNPNLFLPLSKLKSLRKAFWKWIHANIDMDAYKKQASIGYKSFIKDYARKIPDVNMSPATIVKLIGRHSNPIYGSLIARPIEDYQHDAKEVILPEFCQEQKLPELKKKIDSILCSGICRFRATSLFGLSLLKASGAKELIITASFPLAVANSLALEELMDHDVTYSTAWVELEKEAFLDMRQRAGNRIEQFSYGRIPLLTTRAGIPITGEIKDSRGLSFKIVKEKELNRIYSSEIMSMPNISDVSLFIDLSHADFNEKNVSSFNYEHNLV